MTNEKAYKALGYFIAAVWLVSGLFCKVLNLVPRHQQIVARILGDNYSRALTIIIGLLEILMAVWVLTRFRSKLNAVIQMVAIGAMNILEFMLAPGLLLWGKLNIVFAFMFIGLIYYYEFRLYRKLKSPARI